MRISISLLFLCCSINVYTNLIWKRKMCMFPNANVLVLNYNSVSMIVCGVCKVLLSAHVLDSCQIH
jgi:hypothetical protein